VRLTGSWRNQGSAISNTLYSGDRAGSRYYFVLENDRATEAANFTSGRINPGFSDKLSAYMINPFIKVKGAEFFGMYEKAKGRAAPNNNPLREVDQVMAEGVYRFLEGEKLFVGARWSLLLKGELVDQKHEGFLRTDIRNGGRFKGFMIEAVTAF
jgi:hypothetical protein